MEPKETENYYTLEHKFGSNDKKICKKCYNEYESNSCCSMKLKLSREEYFKLALSRFWDKYDASFGSNLAQSMYEFLTKESQEIKDFIEVSDEEMDKVLKKLTEFYKEKDDKFLELLSGK